MAATTPQEVEPTYRSPIMRLLFGLLAFLLVPLVALVILGSIGYMMVSDYQAQHENRIYTGIHISGIDVSGLSPDEARARLNAVIPAANEKTVTIVDPSTGREWTKRSDELGVSYDVDNAIQQAYAVGRNGSTGAQLRGQFDAWYYGQAFAPQVIVDEAYLDQFIGDVSAEIEQPAVDATLEVAGANINFSADFLSQFLYNLNAGIIKIKPATMLIKYVILYPSPNQVPSIISGNKTAM